MIYLSGGHTPLVRRFSRPDIGLMFQPGQGNRPDGTVWWAADNGCFARGAVFDPDVWLKWLTSLAHRDQCLFSVVPDVMGDAQATLERSLPYLQTVRELGYRAAFVTQDGCRSDLIPWSSCDALFVGGSTDWKLSEASWALCKQAKDFGLGVHVGRVNSFRRLQACAVSGVDSVDGTYLKFGPDANLPRLWAWLDHINAQRVLDVSA